MSQLINKTRTVVANYRCEYLVYGQPDNWYVGRYDGPDRDEAVDEARARWRMPTVLGVRIVEQLTRVAEERVKTR